MNGIQQNSFFKWIALFLWRKMISQRKTTHLVELIVTFRALIKK